MLLLGLVTFLRSEGFSRALSGTLALGAIGLQILTFMSGAWPRFRMIDYVAGGFELIFAGLLRAFGLPLVQKSAEGSGQMVFWRRSLPVLRGLLLSFPVVLLLGALLSSADLVFADQVRAIFANFDLGNLPQYLFRLFYILALTFVFAGLLLYAVLPHPQFGTQNAVANLAEGEAEKQADAGGTATAEAAVPGAQQKAQPAVNTRFLGTTEAFIVLGSVDLLFAFFVAIQFRYLFGGQANITAAGYTYSDYTRRGFFELVMVAVISLLLVLLLNAFTRREKPAQERTFTALSVLLVALVWVILASAFQRLLLYEAAYGFTSLRTYTHIFIPWLGFLLLATIVLQLLHRERHFGALLLLTTFGFALTFGVINVDGFIVRQNVARAQAGADLDGAYLLNLSDDAVPALAQEFLRANQPDEVRDTLGAVLSCRAFRESEEPPAAWQSYHVGHALARQSLSALDLGAYPVEAKGRPVYVQLEAGRFDCFPSRSMD